MNRDDLITELELSREKFSALLENLPDPAYLEPLEPGGWTLKDILAHLTFWEAQTITLLFRAHGGGKPNTAHFARESKDELNSRWQSQHADRPLQRVLDDFEGVRNQTIRRLEDFSDRDLTDPRRFRWLNGRPLWEWIAADTIEHEQEHAEQIRTWVQGYSS